MDSRHEGTGKLTSAKFRKRPVVVEAIYNASTHESMGNVMKFLAGSGARCIEAADHNYYFEIPTLEGSMMCSPGDWIIKEPFPTADRQFYPCKPDIFEATYERA